ncbi:PAS domain S-box-containing protein [Fodinibius salinus]|uniref:histidine kinase n=1 Tax=Fodinibius salinus TaxID=860790 RepID=A0A5D3YML8_9BACT|nr:PAS domain S-box protein [Fodinibius salinus]TYP95356.1 PAS domain S-box-containing protein [Fodinibius salinus]
MSNIDSNFLQSVFNSIPDAIVIADKERNIRSVNSTFETIFGFSEQEVIGQKTKMLYASEEDFKQTGQTKYNPTSDINSVIYELDYKRKDGTVFPAETVGSVVKGDEGNTIGYLGITRDLTTQKKRKHELQKLSERLQLLVEITTGTHETIEEAIEESLKKMTKVLNLEVGIISRISGNDYTIEYFYPQDSDLEKGIQFDLANTYCDITYNADGVVGIEHMTESAYEGHPCYEQFELESYIGIPLSANGNRFGTINFSSTSPRTEPFTKADKDMLRLFAEWLSAMIERKKTETKLRESREKFRLISEHSADLVCLHKPDGTYEYVSPSVTDILGYTPDELIGVNPYTLFHPDDLEKVEAQSHSLAKSNQKITSIQYRIKRKDGTYIWFETSTEPITNQQGEVVKLRTGSRDITDRKKLELLLQETNKLAEVGGWEYDVNNDHLYWTDEVYRIHELPVSKEIDIEEAIDFYSPGSRHQIQEAVTRAVEEGIGYDMELPIITAKGNRKWIRAIGKVEQDEEGNVYKVYGVFKDLTKRKEMEEALRERNQALEKLNETTNKIYSVLGHDLKTPLTSIIGFSEVILSDLENVDIDPELKQYLSHINRSAIQMGGMLEDLSRWAQFQTEGFELTIEEISVHETVNDIKELLGPTAEKKGIDLTYDCGNEELLVETDEQMVKTVIRNFISNAIKFSSAGDEIQITCSCSNDHWEISVQDEGAGMTEETQEKLFSSEHPNTRGTKGEKGSGIGLKLCHHLVELQEGEIIIESTLDVGSTFTMRIPRH